jgi:hypothetical protein
LVQKVNAPGYWMNETSGVLRPAIEAYLTRDVMTQGEIAAMRAYLRQWICRGAWHGDEIEALKARVDGLESAPAIDQWLHDARAHGIDPL